MYMDLSLVSRTNVREVLELLDVIELTQVSSLLDTWSNRTYRTIDYHQGLVYEGAYLVFYDPLERRKIDQLAATNQASSRNVVPEGMIFGRVHKDDGIERNTRDESPDHNRCVRIKDSLPQINQAPSSRMM